MSGAYHRPRVPWRRTGKQPKTTAYRCQHADHWHIGHVDVHAREHFRRTA